MQRLALQRNLAIGGGVLLFIGGILLGGVL
jgi:hypothetical protein